MKIKQFILIPTLALFAISTVFAQNADYRSTISATAGANVFQIFNLFDSALSDSFGTEIKIKATASYGLAYDYGINKWFSLGIAGAYNRVSFDAANVSVDREDGSTYDGPLGFKASRTNIALRPLFHYGNKGRIDMYTGFRIGVNVYNASITQDNNQEPIAPNDVNRFWFVRDNVVRLGGQFIPFGLRGYITKNIGLGFEIGIGAPHYAALQLNYRL